jgi:hypothetical protein
MRDAGSVTPGQRLRARRDVELPVMIVARAPGNETSRGTATISAGTVLVAVGGAPGATAINVYPEDYEALGPFIVRSPGPDYGGYGLVIQLQDLDDDFELVPAAGA